MSEAKTYRNEDYEMVRAAIADWEATAAAYGVSVAEGMKHYAGKQERCLMCGQTGFDWLEFETNADGSLNKNAVEYTLECADCPIKKTTGHVCARHKAVHKIDETIFEKEDADAKAAAHLARRVAEWLRIRVLAVMETT